MMWPSSQASKILSALLFLVLVYCICMDTFLFLRIQNYKIDLFDVPENWTESSTRSAVRNYEDVIWVPCSINPICHPTVKGLMVDHINHYIYAPLCSMLDIGLKISEKLLFLTPNMISFSHVIIACIGAKLLTCQNLAARRLAIVLFQIRMFLDDLDGHVARERKHIKGERSEYLYEIGHRVCVTQPRVAAALTLANRVADERGVQLGGEVGCAASMTSIRTPDSGIVFMTEGVLLREMFASPLLMQYSCIVLDEVHERTQMTDVLMGLLKKIARKRKNLKLVISSATMDADFLKNFFDLSNKGGSSTSVIMSIQGRTHPIDIFYVEEPVPDYVNATIDTVIKIHENEPFGDILAFLTSQEEILTARETLNLYAEQNNEKNKHRKFFSSGIQSADMEVLPMYGSLPHYAQVKVFQMRNQNVRKVILSTNVAETSVTIPGITYVIDSGFHKLAYFDPVVGVQCVRAAPVSRNNATQRSGRVGRARSGKCYRLYTEEQYDKLPVCVPPEMCRSDLSSMLLQLKALGISNVLKFTFPTPPPAKCLLSGLETLYALKIIDKQGNLTEIGKQAAELPLKPMCAVILCNGGEFGCIQEILSIVAMLQVDNVFIKPSGKQNMAAKISRRNNFEVAEGDLIMYLNIFDAYQKVKLTHTEEKKAIKACKDWCNKMYLNYRVMEKAAEIRDSLEKLIKTKFKIENKIYEGVELGPAKCERIMKCVVSGLFPQSAFLYTDSSYRGIRGATLHISPDSCLYNTQQPQWLVFAGVQSTGDKIYMRQVMTIKKEWLTELAPHYYVEN